ncbi:hypothetical protein PPTG_23065 [Phytophthora nicotianae INRA-310]|uniref:Uncharacterized protein n=1 Tax=Phytophthora nicotianae (strain INRA-310) TaxID=761204 RepID=W2Q7A5_PHYN3|nr:hypothetical protein PPTG_23065 [Phytophthora nicotianae INRA-310]ETN08145.1 hypothetical protein PPTG_23065 [Phytophthora nicotianae INRA-310]
MEKGPGFHKRQFYSSDNPKYEDKPTGPPLEAAF